jgi:hypothetical protein
LNVVVAAACLAINKGFEATIQPKYSPKSAEKSAALIAGLKTAGCSRKNPLFICFLACTS